MRIHLRSLSRLGLWLAALLTLTLIFTNTHLPTTQAENSTVDKAVPAQGNTTLGFTKQCNGNDFVLTITGDGPFNINGYAPSLPHDGGMPVNGFAGSSITFTGPGNWYNITVDELGGDLEHFNLGDMICPALPNRPLQISAYCDSSDNELFMNMTSGDGPVMIEGNYAGLPMSMPWPTLIWLPGPNVFTGVTIRELAGDYETYTLPDIGCGFGLYSLQASASCSGTTLQVDIPVGDGPFHLINNRGYYITLYGTGPHYLPDYVALYGPMTGLTVRERSGDYETVILGDISCDTSAPTSIAPVILPIAPVILPDYVPARVMEISSAQQHMVYDRPGGDPIHNPDNSLLLLPQDADGNGSDTFIVLDAQLYEGEVWLGIYLGGPNLGWLPEADLYPAIEE